MLTLELGCFIPLGNCYSFLSDYTFGIIFAFTELERLMSDASQENNSSPLRWVLLLLIFVGAVFAANILLSFLGTVLKWGLIALVAVGVTGFVARRFLKK